jgi:2-keto-3-deoxy-L-rhamnonate aldolase RhmA
MNVNPLKAKWAAGATTFGAMLAYSRDVATIEIAAAAGLDFVLFDLEHRPHGSETIHDLSQVARLAGLASLVGPKDVSHHAISHALDLGASGVVVPHVSSVDEVSTIIDAVRYAPRGARGRAGTAGHNLYVPGRPMAEEMDDYNASVALLLKVESEAGISDIDDLVGFDEVDGVMVGPADLSVDMGISGQVRHERVLDAMRQVRDACKRRGIQYGVYLMSPDDLGSAIEDGASWIVLGSEMDALARTWGGARELVKSS